ncbi:MAG TPA: tannase/feruloyl esterase family alpha/beta hydrolase [Candidatus Angelobacter sp.]|nr:tannase/feruloyl esterase family alpha/beta hydrolase [Candidatus Angelobacter sp.]
MKFYSVFKSARKPIQPTMIVPTMIIILALAMALTASPAWAALPGCTAGALSALGVPNLTILSATDVPAAPPNPEFCNVFGVLSTTGDHLSTGSATFFIQLPANWNGKFLVYGNGGLAGAPFGSPNPVDQALALIKGYATAVSDTGHTGHGLTPADGLGIATDARWALPAPATPDTTKITDYYFRATHDLTVAGKELVKGFFGAPKIERSYFDGCSNGGRMAFVEATRFPDDFDGIVAGAPFMDIRSVIAGAGIQKTQLRSPSAYIPAALLPMIDQAVYASCDAADGVKDNLIQNPAKCSFDPETLVCKKGQTSNCLSHDQANTLRAYFSATRDEDGRFIYTGAAVSDLHGGGYDAWTSGFIPPTSFSANEPWGNLGFSPAPIGWQFVDHILKFIVETDPNFDVRNFGVSGGVVRDGALDLFDRKTEAGDGDVPSRVLPFIARNNKLLIYHGFSDPALPAFRTIKWYENLSELTGGFGELQENVRLFMVPGMQHCGGGPGPNIFDTLTPLEDWVEHGIAPNGILAAHFVNNDPTQGVDRTMPLCQFPEQAHFNGTGNVNNAANWSCTANRKLLDVGPNGAMAGLGDDDDDRDHDHERRDHR